MTVEYDPFSHEVIHGDNHGIYKRLREEAPVYFMPRWDAYALSRFEDVWWACEGDFVSNARGATTAHLLTKVQPVLPLLNNMDPPDHTKLRGGLRKHFMPARMRSLDPWIREVVTTLLDQWSSGDAAEQTQILNDLLAKGVDGIAVSPKDAANQTEILNKVASQTLLVCHDSDAPNTKRTAYVGTDNVAAGVEAGKLIKEALPSGGKIMVFVGTMDARLVALGLIISLLATIVLLPALLPKETGHR